jgi:hypothetical protein
MSAPVAARADELAAGDPEGAVTWLTNAVRELADDTPPAPVH